MPPRRSINVSEGVKVTLSAGLFVALVGGVFTSAVEFYKLRSVILETWSYQNEKDVWHSFEVLNNREFPTMRFPNPSQIRKDSLYGDAQFIGPRYVSKDGDVEQASKAN